MWAVGRGFCHFGMDTNDLNHDLTTSPWLPPTLCWELSVCLYIMCHLITDLLTAFANNACIELNCNVSQVKCVKYNPK